MLLLDNKPDTSIDIVKIYEKVSRKSSKNEEVHCIEEDPCSPNLNDEDDYEPEFGIYLDIGKTTDKLYTLLDRCLTKDILNDVIGTLEPMAIVHKQELLDMGILSRISSLISEHHKTKSNDEIMGLLLMVLKIFLFGKDKPKFYQANRLIQHASIMEELMESNIFCILEEGFKNTSVSDISERLGLYKALLAISASLSSCPEFVPYFFQLKDSRSIAGIFAEFCSVLNNYLCLATDKQTVDPELIGFINQADDLFLAMKKLASNDDQPPKIKKTKLANDLVNVEASTSENISTEDLNKIYAESLRFYQIQSFKMHGRYHRSLAEELNQSDPHSAASTPRSNRIAKELASMYHALPLGSSGSIFICLDEERCDVLKALISGPEDTPYANGLFEFDVFFPNSYPNSPPKCQCMTSGNRIRFNPNL
uniref:UBC core domain-containing protein n=1 Tax=Acrobeloides nanus TaxID=290746 RepID=A0A914DCR6_9BILA